MWGFLVNNESLYLAFLIRTNTFRKAFIHSFTHSFMFTCRHPSFALPLLPLPPVHQWNSVKPLGGRCIRTRHKQNGDPLLKSLLHSAICSQRHDRLTLSYVWGGLAI